MKVETDRETTLPIMVGTADGMGLAIARALVAEPGQAWRIHLVDVKPEEEAGRHAVASLLSSSSGTTNSQVVYHQADVIDYAQLAAVFRAAFLGGDGGQRRLDWVFANAGVFERTKYFTDDDEPPSKDRGDDNDEPPPPPPDYKALEVNLQGAVNTVHLARHYISRSTAAGGGEVEGEGGSGSIVVTASCSSFWPTYWAPIYTASKCMYQGDQPAYFWGEGGRGLILKTSSPLPTPPLLLLPIHQMTPSPPPPRALPKS